MIGFILGTTKTSRGSNGMMESNIREQLLVGSRPFDFSLCRKAVQMGNIPVDHWWMKTTELYGQRGKPCRQASNFQAVTDYFWALCREEGTAHDSEVQESYLLSKILPYSRSHGSRRVFTDAWLFGRDRSSKVTKAEVVAELEQFLRTGRIQVMTRTEFEEKTTKMLGPRGLTAEEICAYKEFTNDFLGRACATFQQNEQQGIQQTITAWQKAMNSVGRRGGHRMEKRILDIVSYEARAALHRCYSAVWSNLLPHLEKKHGLSSASTRFLELWHLDQVQDRGPGSPAYWHLFHGHVFGLHPASAQLLRTSAGRELVGQWLENPESDEAFGRLLYAIFLAVCCYSGQKELLAQRRKKQPYSASNDLEGIEEHEEGERRRGRRHPKPRKMM
jgi:hypothetical protein